MTARVVLVLLLIASACSSPPRPATAATPSPTAPQAGTVPPNRAPPPATAPATCGGPPLRVAFYAVGQGLAALITLPDDRHILVDTGESPTRPGCGKPCKLWHQHLMAGLAHDLGDAPIDLLWITHPHSDHIGGAVDVLATFPVATYVDNGRDLTGATVRRTRDAAAAHGIPITARRRSCSPATPRPSRSRS